MSEIKELQAEVRKLEEWIHVAQDDRDYFKDKAEKAAAEERAAIVAYLREGYLTCDRNTAAFFADAIEQQHDRWNHER